MATSQTWLLRPFQERSTQLFLGVLFAALVVVTFLHLFMPEDSALHVSAYTVTLLGKYLCYALLAVAVDLVWGYLAFSAWATAPSLPSAATPWACT